jgi:ribosome maturation factor RimP
MVGFSAAGSIFAPAKRRMMEEGPAPLFCSPFVKPMIDTQRLSQTLERQLAGSPYFVVTAEVRPSGKAIVEIDNDSHITLSELTEINRGLREAFGAELDDVELEVGSPGLDRPFRVLRQYHKHIGRQVQVKLSDGGFVEGVLEAVDDKGISLRVQQPSKVKGRPPKLDREATAIPFAAINEHQNTHHFQIAIVP